MMAVIERSGETVDLHFPRTAHMSTRCDTHAPYPVGASESLPPIFPRSARAHGIHHPLLRVLVASLVLLCMMASARSVRAQQQPTSVNVRVVDSQGRAVQNALIALRDAQGRTITEAATSSAGRARLATPPGAYTVHARRMGFLPEVAGMLTVPTVPSGGGATEFVITLRGVSAARLATVKVSSQRQCRRNALDGGPVARLWSDVATALRVSELTRQDLADVTRIRVYAREVLVSGEVLTDSSSIVPIGNARPFGTQPPASLAELGYVRGDELRGWVYFGPDERVLLSPEFLSTHCYHIVRDSSRAGEVGLAFEPVGRRWVRDIKGVIWVEELSNEVREVVFEYTNAGPLTTHGAGGFTKFRRLPSGAYMVEEWQLKAPRLRYRSGSVMSGSLQGYLMNGGRVVSDSTER